jgi:hypothetical protein
VINFTEPWVANYKTYFSNRFWSIFRHFLSKTGVEKNRRFVKILGRFLTFWIVLGRYRIYRKTAPTKSTVLGPGPPPWDFIENYRFLWFFHDFGAFNRAGKTVTKIGIYSKPPPKKWFLSSFYWNFYTEPFFSTNFVRFPFSIVFVWPSVLIASLKKTPKTKEPNSKEKQRKRPNRKTVCLFCQLLVYRDKTP